MYCRSEPLSLMAKMTNFRSIDIHCASCRTKLYKYRKGGTGSLVKCIPERILEDHTGGSLTCPGCGQAFAREAAMGGKTVYKIIGSKVFTKGMRRK
jgi:hypothetical protein